ncbi:D-glycero-alpha-D-manno-heptose-1,7-bisphosphate 7-phosphatase [Pararhodospirillum photometricum]|uniref:D-glycero-alpha-D-manno-heptose-1,7-bisphosphate 7-phosphatase n=1 Tax=Pararhodospirillum photometricum TaxID=1084 RepID=UPI0003148FD4|nr:HAD family hydrolase [Pararhodospirillum photometricum]
MSVASDRRVVLLDRDGTINEEVHYLAHPDQLRLLPGVASGLRRLAQAGFALVVVTNQSGIARGLITPAALDAIHARLRDLLAAEGVVLEGIHACPHGPDDGCACRKPRPGLVEAAQKQNPFDPRRAFMVGDKKADLDLGRTVGAFSILVRTGYGRQVEATSGYRDAPIVDDLDAAARLILQRSS